MLKKHPALTSILSSLLLLAYISGVALFMNNVPRFLGEKPEVPGFILFLSLFVFSALVCGLLLLGGPIYLYLENEKKTALKMLAYNIIFFLTSGLIIFGLILIF